MKPRDTQVRPQPGDRFLYRGWTILVTQRVGGDVFLTGTHADGRMRPETPQAVTKFREWASEATPLLDVVEPAQIAECVATANVAAPCDVDGVPIVGRAHVFDGKVRCAQHCPAQHKPEKRKKAIA